MDSIYEYRVDAEKKIISAYSLQSSTFPPHHIGIISNLSLVLPPPLGGCFYGSQPTDMRCVCIMCGCVAQQETSLLHHTDTYNGAVRVQNLHAWKVISAIWLKCTTDEWERVRYISLYGRRRSRYMRGDATATHIHTIIKDIIIHADVYSVKVLFLSSRIILTSEASTIIQLPATTTASPLCLCVYCERCTADLGRII